MGSGWVPVVPGTAGSVVGLALVFLLHLFSPIIYLSFFILVLVVGTYCAGQVERAYQVKDSPHIVIDEIAGMLVAAFLIPNGTVFLLAAFLLFRFLDIIKPYPARWIQQHVSGGPGIMLDDVVAGLYTNLILQGVRQALG